MSKRLSTVTHIGDPCQRVKADGEVCGSTWRYDKSKLCVVCIRAARIKHDNKVRARTSVNMRKAENWREIEAKMDFSQENLTPIH